MRSGMVWEEQRREIEFGSL